MSIVPPPCGTSSGVNLCRTCVCGHNPVCIGPVCVWKKLFPLAVSFSPALTVFPTSLRRSLSLEGGRGLMIQSLSLNAHLDFLLFSAAEVQKEDQRH